MIVVYSKYSRPSHLIENHHSMEPVPKRKWHISLLGAENASQKG